MPLRGDGGERRGRGGSARRRGCSAPAGWDPGDRAAERVCSGASLQPNDFVFNEVKLKARVEWLVSNPECPRLRWLWAALPCHRARKWIEATERSWIPPCLKNGCCQKWAKPPAPL